MVVIRCVLLIGRNQGSPHHAPHHTSSRRRRHRLLIAPHQSFERRPFGRRFFCLRPTAVRNHQSPPPANRRRTLAVSGLSGWIADMGDDQTKPDMTGLLALVGELLLKWGWLEHHLDGRPIPSGLDGIRLLRNQICHGLVQARSDPYNTSEPAFVVCKTFDGTLRTVTAQELRDAVRKLSRPPD